MNIHLPRLYAELVADLILKSDRSTMEDYHDWEHLDNFAEDVENMIRLEKSIARCGLRQFGMMAVTPGMIESVDVTPEVALSLAYFMESYKRGRE